MSFLEALVDQGLLTPEEMAKVSSAAVKKYSGDVDEALAKESNIDEESLLLFKSGFFGIPSRAITYKELDPKLFDYISVDSAKQYGFVPVGLKDKVLEIGIVNPARTDSLDALQFISSRTQIPYKLFVITQKTYNSVLEGYKGITGEVDQALSDLDSELSSEAIDSSKTKKPRNENDAEEVDEKKIVEEAPIIKVVAVILRHAIEGSASDIHIENTGKEVKVRFRVDGELHTSLTLPLNVYSGVVARIKILAKLRLDEKRKPQDGGFTAKIDGRKIDLRVSTFPAYYGEKVVMRILDAEKGVKTLEDLDMSEEHLNMVKKALEVPYGIVLITGPTGSGKTTTLYAMLNEIDRESKNVVSLEDPVEYHVDGVSQSQVMPEIGYTFASGLRSILRQDPDVILVGEIRDKETAALAIQAALTGHLVLSTLHTNNAAGAIPRLIDMGVDPFLIAPTLVLAIAQRLAKKTCDDSKQEMPIDEATSVMINKEFADLPEQYKAKIKIGDKMIKTVPSKTCPSGTKGRMAIFEMFEVDKDIESVILKSPTELDILNAVRAKGMLTMKEDALIKAVNGNIPITEVYKF
jgi:type II secretory ATPase GspE/PulE/Tfp pilus assembly ATPase PilB-like protein